MINTSQDLKDLLFRINRKSYPAYKDTKGSYRFPGYVLSIDHVQGDPFAAPSKLSLHIKGAQAGFPEALYPDSFLPSYGSSLLISLGNKQASLTLSSPSNCMVSRSRPIPSPPCGGIPKRNASRYCSRPSSVIPFS